MRILALNYEYPPLGGGGGVVFKALMETLAQRHHVTVVTSLFEGLARFEQIGDLSIHRVPVIGRTGPNTATLASLLSYFPSSWRLGTRLMRRHRFEVINSHFAVPSAPSAQLLARRFGVPHVLSLHGGDLYDPSKTLSPHRVPVLRNIVRRLMVRADRVVAQSSNTEHNARTYYRIARDIEVIPLGIVPAKIPPATRADYGVEDDRFVIVTVGRLVARKALGELLNIVAEMNDPKDLLVVVGEGPQRAELELRTRSLGIAACVRFVGRVSEPDKWRLLSISDVYASTSLHEGFGLVFLEGMHCGLPVVCYDHGGQTDFLTDGKTGAVLPAGDHDTFRRALQILRSDPDKRRSIGSYNRARVCNYYIDACASRYEQVFESAIAQYDTHRC